MNPISAPITKGSVLGKIYINIPGQQTFQEDLISSEDVGKMSSLIRVKSILKFAPFVRKIFIVTDSQKPSFSGLEDLIVSNKVKVVDHKEIFKGYEKYLPTFNIRSIDAVLHRIEGLSEMFVYFNDDVFLINKIHL